MLHPLAALLIAILTSTPEREVAPGEPVPSLQGVEWIQGPPITEFTRGRVYAVEFWSTWCAACITSIELMNDLARQYESSVTFVAVHIWHRPPAPRPADFLVQRRKDAKPIPQFAVADDASGVIADAWMEATQSSGLPTAMIVDREGRLIWLGDSRAIHRPLQQVVQGQFDLPAGIASLKKRIRAGELASASSRAIETGDYAQGAKLALEALSADPEAAAPWMPGTYCHLLAASGSPTVADEFVRNLLATDAGRHPHVLTNLAYVILHFEPKALRNLQFALELARKAQQSRTEPDVDLIGLIARLRAELGDRRGAIAELEAAIQTVEIENRTALEEIRAELSSRR